SNSTFDKHSESNFYGILANLLIHQTYYHQLNLKNAITDKAYDLANKTMSSIVNNMWDETAKAFRYRANSAWNPFVVPGGTRYHLDVNALGIITLLEFWVGSGMESDFLEKAVNLYNSLDDHLWNLTGDDLYSNIAESNWFLFDSSTNLNSNALMLEACIRLFQLTGNITYYNRAIELFDSFEKNLYDSVNKAYDFSISDSSKNFNTNLKLYDAYLKTSETYSSTILRANYNLTATVPDLVFNQDIMNLTSVYAFENTEYYYNL
ncbi:unnamed protein product, partial [marine sediment metagenome]